MQHIHRIPSTRTNTTQTRENANSNSSTDASSSCHSSSSRSSSSCRCTTPLSHEAYISNEKQSGKQRALIADLTGRIDGMLRVMGPHVVAYALRCEAEHRVAPTVRMSMKPCLSSQQDKEAKGKEETVRPLPSSSPSSSSSSSSKRQERPKRASEAWKRLGTLDFYYYADEEEYRRQTTG